MTSHSGYLMSWYQPSRPKLLVALFTFSLASCGTQSSSKLSGQSEVNPLILSFGGYGTCARDTVHGSWETPIPATMFVKASDIRAKLAKEFGVEARLIASCFTMRYELRYVDSADEFAELHVNQAIPAFTDFIDSEMERHSQVYIIGHSYGGWLAMNIANRFQGATDRIHSLFSLDPISGQRCRFENPMSWNGCREAPADIPDDRRQLIQEKTQIWRHFWQDQTFYLHSSAIEHADQNQKLELSHTQINDAPLVWQEQWNQIKTDF